MPDASKSSSAGSCRSRTESTVVMVDTNGPQPPQHRSFGHNADPVRASAASFRLLRVCAPRRMWHKDTAHVSRQVLRSTKGHVCVFIIHQRQSASVSPPQPSTTNTQQEAVGPSTARRDDHNCTLLLSTSRPCVMVWCPAFGCCCDSKHQHNVHGILRTLSAHGVRAQPPGCHSSHCSTTLQRVLSGCDSAGRAAFVASERNVIPL